MRERVPPIQNSKKNAREVGGEAAISSCAFFELWRRGTRSRIIVLEVAASSSLILGHAKWAAKPPTFGALFWRRGTRSRIV